MCCLVGKEAPLRCLFAYLKEDPDVPDFPLLFHTLMSKKKIVVSLIAIVISASALTFGRFAYAASPESIVVKGVNDGAVYTVDARAARILKNKKTAALKLSDLRSGDTVMIKGVRKGRILSADTIIDGVHRPVAFKSKGKPLVTE